MCACVWISNGVYVSVGGLICSGPPLCRGISVGCFIHRELIDMHETYLLGGGGRGPNSVGCFNICIRVVFWGLIICQAGGGFFPVSKFFIDPFIHAFYSVSYLRLNLASLLMELDHS